MKKIYLSDAGPKVSPAIYGFYRWGSNDLEVKKMESIINLCLELGINTFDHADIYGGYRCEKLFGDVIKSKGVKREDIVLFTKCGLVVPHLSKPDVRVKYYDTSSEHILKSVDNSLRQLQTDYIDIFLLNELDPLSNLEETAVTLRQLRESGKVKNIGVVNFSVFQHQLLSSYLKIPIVTNHIELNLLNTSAFDNGQIDYIKQKYMRPLATSPLAEGLIAESNAGKASLIRKKLESFVPKYNAHFESIAIAWILKLGALPLIGTTSEQRIKNIVKSFDLDLSRQDWYELYEASRGNI
ncbi:MAG: aldo/keto reductase [Bacteroidetes bacterium]|nr:MAG: aldo/keto reductase [Bacteroidota bacterium]